jgi:hypothetical protein
MLDSDECFFLLAKFRYFSTKKLRNFWNFFFPSGSRTNFVIFLVKFRHNLDIKKMKKKKTIDSHQGLVGIFYSIFPSLDLGDKITKHIRNKLIPN